MRYLKCMTKVYVCKPPSTLTQFNYILKQNGSLWTCIISTCDYLVHNRGESESGIE